MLLSGIVVLAAFYGFAPSDARTIVNIDKVEVTSAANHKIVGKWKASLTKANPVNKLSMETPLTGDLAEDTFMLRLKATINGIPLPEYESKACEALKDEMIGKGVIAAGNPFPEACPVEKDNYALDDYALDLDKMPDLPAGNMKGTLELYESGKDAAVTIKFEATISQ